MTHHVTHRILPSLVVALSVLAMEVSTFGQRPDYASLPPGSGAVPMRPYGESAGCSEEPAMLHRCALEKARTFNPPRTPEGVPDFQGFWVRIGARNSDNIEEHPQGFEGPGGRSLIIDPPDGRIPYQPWARAKVETHWATYWSPVQQCMPDTPPRQAYTNGAFEVVQTPGYVFVMAEQFGTYRAIPTTPRPHIGSSIHLYMGDSRGRWEGNTLVIDVTSVKDRVWFDNMGNTFSESAHVVERFTMFHQDALHYQATVTDPSVFTRPMTLAFGWRRNKTPGFQMLETACWEGIQGWLKLFSSLKETYRGGFTKQ
ncbi:MAG: hypothetical protein A3I61_17380 [Acidobacteria bacterium RIFCSPLOWO2_02_FULL_68_18]|nr:MAG: hypothetical protein A3I61_17380 [Acidobacteria bacterium RIFCSPLOWO2_02_FULL_68_18]OFW50451.1 MAG: hypothetical protein A3G77_11955 [Acidobacteria bacterium RIFCSPLOWO2_12_FULL_68_19]